MKRRLILVSLFAVVIGLQAPLFTRADDATSTSGSGTSIVEQIGCDQTVTVNGVVTINRACGVNDFINLFIYLSKWGMSILAMLATLMIVYGGFQFITAGGRPSKVDEGKRVILGTVVGTVITLTAYIIINTTFAAISGTKVASNNPFGVVSTVFDTPEARSQSIQGQTIPINRPFTGITPSNVSTSNNGSTVSSCQKVGGTWNHSCAAGAYQINCADPETGERPIRALQQALKDKGCDCNGVDSCYGPGTVKCVRQFQIANKLPPSGVIDTKTQDLINGVSVNCSAADPNTLAKLPDTVMSTAPATATGCCVVKKGADDLYCVNNLNNGACEALGAGSELVSGVACGTGSTSLRCGFCSNNTNPSPTLNNSSCYSFVSFHWCSNAFVIPQSQPSFFGGACDGRCQTCVHSLVNNF